MLRQTQLKMSQITSEARRGNEKKLKKYYEYLAERRDDVMDEWLANHEFTATNENDVRAQITAEIGEIL